MTKNESYFLTIYVICGLTDFADGFIARKFNITTPVGAKLDSFADMVFCFATLYYIYSKIQLTQHYLIICVLLIFSIRITNILITKIKFKQWNVIHTLGNKATGLALFLIPPIYAIFGRIPTIIGTAFAILAFISSIEETCVILLFKYYDVNHKSLLRYIHGKICLNYTKPVER